MGSHYISKIKKYYQLAKINHTENGHRHPFLQCCEMMLVFIVTGIFPGYYLQSSMGEKKWSYLMGFLTQKRYVKAVHKVNDGLYHRTSMNKMVEKAMLTTYGIPTPKLIGFYNPLRGRSIDGAPLTSTKELLKLLKKSGLKKLCLKPTSSFGGKGVKIVELLNDSKTVHVLDYSHRKEQPFDLFWNEYLSSIFLDETEGVVIEECLEQEDTFSKYNPSSVNTVRVMVHLDKPSGEQVFGAFLRVGREGSVIDNGSSGGIMVRVDPRTGQLGCGCFSKLSKDQFSKHPDSKVRFVGEFLPNWDEIKELSINTVKLFPGIRYAGLDIAVSKSGPVVIEMNVQPDYVDFALVKIPSKKVFGYSK